VEKKEIFSRRYRPMNSSTEEILKPVLGEAK